MKHLILGTAGHVDHGKTSLVKALTGIDCDTHAEEKRRGITINLGFASLKLPSGEQVGIVDVPGHRDFVNTMVSGASAIDIALMVIAADGGVMPQTREHLKIMQMLGIKTGITVLTRTDISNPEQIQTTVREIGELTKGTFLNNCPVVQVSSKTGEGLEQLKTEISRVASRIQGRPQREVFRMYIDRIFSVSGFGTVVTGSVLSGRLTSGSGAYLLPSGKELRVRRMEHHGQEVMDVVAGDRASLNLAGLSRDEYSRGMLISDRMLRSTQLLDAKIQLFDKVRDVELWSQADFLMGTYDAHVKIHLINKDVLRNGETAIAQIHCPHPCVAQAGDKFILRSSSNDCTIGGGEIIDASPLHHRKRSAKLITNLQRILDGKLPELVAAEIRKSYSGISIRDIANTLNISVQEILDCGKDLPEDIGSMASGTDTFLFTKKQFENTKNQILSSIKQYHDQHPLDKNGRTTDELAGSIGMNRNAQNIKLLHCILERMCNEKIINKAGHTYTLISNTVHIDRQLIHQVTVIENFFLQCGMKTPLLTDLESVSRQNGITTANLKQILSYLSDEGRLHKIESQYLHDSVVSMARTKIVEELKKHPQGLTVAQFRDLINGNRKICLLLFALFDKEGITDRTGDVRRLSEKAVRQ